MRKGHQIQNNIISNLLIPNNSQNLVSNSFQITNETRSDKQKSMIEAKLRKDIEEKKKKAEEDRRRAAEEKKRNLEVERKSKEELERKKKLEKLTSQNNNTKGLINSNNKNDDLEPSINMNDSLQKGENHNNTIDKNDNELRNSVLMENNINLVRIPKIEESSNFNPFNEKNGSDHSLRVITLEKAIQGIQSKDDHNSNNSFGNDARSNNSDQMRSISINTLDSLIEVANDDSFACSSQSPINLRPSTKQKKIHIPGFDQTIMSTSANIDIPGLMMHDEGKGMNDESLKKLVSHHSTANFGNADFGIIDDIKAMNNINWGFNKRPSIFNEHHNPPNLVSNKEDISSSLHNRNNNIIHNQKLGQSMSTSNLNNFKRHNDNEDDEYAVKIRNSARGDNQNQKVLTDTWLNNADGEMINLKLRQNRQQRKAKDDEYSHNIMDKPIESLNNRENSSKRPRNIDLINDQNELVTVVKKSVEYALQMVQLTQMNKTPGIQGNKVYNNNKIDKLMKIGKNHRNNYDKKGHYLSREETEKSMIMTELNSEIDKYKQEKEIIKKEQEAVNLKVRQKILNRLLIGDQEPYQSDLGYLPQATLNQNLSLGHKIQPIINNALYVKSPQNTSSRPIMETRFSLPTQSQLTNSALYLDQAPTYSNDTMKPIQRKSLVNGFNGVIDDHETTLHLNGHNVVEYDDRKDYMKQQSIPNNTNNKSIINGKKSQQILNHSSNESIITQNSFQFQTDSSFRLSTQLKHSQIQSDDTQLGIITTRNQSPLQEISSKKLEVIPSNQYQLNSKELDASFRYIKRNDKEDNVMLDNSTGEECNHSESSLKNQSHNLNNGSNLIRYASHKNFYNEPLHDRNTTSNINFTESTNHFHFESNTPINQTQNLSEGLFITQEFTYKKLKTNATTTKNIQRNRKTWVQKKQEPTMKNETNQTQNTLPIHKESLIQSVAIIEEEDKGIIIKESKCDNQQQESILRNEDGKLSISNNTLKEDNSSAVVSVDNDHRKDSTNKEKKTTDNPIQNILNGIKSCSNLLLLPSPKSDQLQNIHLIQKPKLSTPQHALAMKTPRGDKTVISKNFSFNKTSNIKLIKNAINTVCLAGDANLKNRQTLLAKIDELKTDHNLIILFKGLTGRQDFKALYSFDPVTSEVRRIIAFSNSPAILEPSMIHSYYRYDSGAKEFKLIPANKTFSLAIDAVSVYPNTLKNQNAIISNNTNHHLQKVL